MEKYKFPTECPHCSTSLEQDNMHLYCPNDDCDGKLFYQFIYGVNALNLDFLGEATLEKIYFNTPVKTPFDLFDNTKFNQKQLISGGFPDGRNIERILEQIEKIDSVDIKSTFLMLGIPNLGKRLSEELAKKFSGVKYSTFGLEKKFFDYFESDNFYYNKWINGLQVLKNNGIDIKNYKEDVNQITFEMSGEPPDPFKSKSDFTDEVLQYGCKHVSLNKDTQYLIVDDYKSNTGKVQKANKYKIKIFTYDDFIEYLKNNNSI